MVDKPPATETLEAKVVCNSLRMACICGAIIVLFEELMRYANSCFTIDPDPFSIPFIIDDFGSYQSMMQFGESIVNGMKWIPL